MPDTKRRTSSGNVFEDLGFDQEEAANFAVRTDLMGVIRRYIKASNLTQAQAAERLGVTQPRVSDLVNLKVDLFSIDMLVNMLARLGISGRFVLVDAEHPEGVAASDYTYATEA